MKFRTLPVVVAIVVSCTLLSCLNENDSSFPLKAPANSFQGKQTVLGKRLRNPYTIDNMLAAQRKLAVNDSLFLNVSIFTTHYYVKFKPQNYSQYDLLRSDTTIHFLDHPFEYEVVEQGDYYHDPSLPDTVPTFQYAAVPKQYEFPQQIPYEILDNLFLPVTEGDGPSSGREMTQDEDLISALENEAMLLTGNIPAEEDPSAASSARTNGLLPSKWYPSGRILVYDNRVKDFIPLRGAKVQARHWFKVATAYTNLAGFYSMDKGFRYEVNYSIPWERSHFDIRSGTFGQARFNGPKQKGGWNLKIYQNGISFHYAHVFRAAMRYYYGDIGGLRRPGFRLKYSVFDKQGNHLARNIGNWSLFGANPNILIYRFDPSDGTENDSDEMFSTTCHETAHTTHMEVMNAGIVQFLQVSEQIRESWAVGVEWHITQMEYKELGITNYADPSYAVRVNYPIRHAFQYWDRGRMPNVTSLFIDIVDQNNQRGQSFGNYQEGTVDDPLYGYTFANIESKMLQHVYGLSSLREELTRHKPDEVGENQIDILLQNF